MMTTDISLRTGKAIAEEVAKNSGITLSIDCVIFGYDNGELKILVIDSDYDRYFGMPSLLGDLVHPNEGLDEAVMRVLANRTGLSNVYLEEVTTFGKVDRHPEGRVVTVAYCALINSKHYQLKINTNELRWVSFNDLKLMAFDHYEIAQASLEWLKKKIQIEPIVFNLLPNKFSLRELQNVYTAILGESLDRRNFRKKILSLEYITDTGEYETEVTHRPGRLFKFDKSIA